METATDYCEPRSSQYVCVYKLSLKINSPIGKTSGIFASRTQLLHSIRAYFNCLLIFFCLISSLPPFPVMS